MQVLLVVDRVDAWPVDLGGAQVVSARDYVSNTAYSELRNAKVFNLCRSNAYQAIGYYVSLLAAARRHKPLPSVTTIRDMKSSAIIRIAGEHLDELVQRVFAPLQSTRFEVSIYFGRNLAERYSKLCQLLFDQFPVPLMRAEFVYDGRWRLQSLKVLSFEEVPPNHHEFLWEQARRFLARRVRPANFRPRYDLAILVDPDETDAPSNPRAIQRFIKAARKCGIAAEVIGRDDYAHIAEFDALFIRQTTSVNHFTYRFASRAAAEGLVVIDDPESIIRCTNKVYQAEVFRRLGIPTPNTVIVHRDNIGDLQKQLQFPVVLKQPDSSFSQGVIKVSDQAELRDCLRNMLRKSELVVAQEFAPSEFDWRIGVIDGEPIYGCKYFMARGHWQIQKTTGSGGRSYGKAEALPVDALPKRAVDMAVRSAKAVGDGLYGVDIKQRGDQFLAIEINDNPNIDAGIEDAVLGDELYDRIMRSFLKRMERRGLRAGDP